MIDIQIPGYKRLQIRHLVLDYNGTLAIDGALIAGVEERLRRLSTLVEIDVITADTFGCVERGIASLPVTLTILAERDQAEAKAAFVSDLGAETCAAIGNGYNDKRMLLAADLGIAVVQGEGASQATVAAADIVFTNINDALDALLNTGRIAAGLRR